MKYFKFFSKRFTLLLFLLPLTLMNCAGPYTYNDNGSIIELSEDDPFQIILEGDLESDYYWEMISENTYVKLQKPVIITTDVDRIVYTFDFKTISNGEQKIELIYTNGKDIESVFQLDVIIGSLGIITSDL